MPKSTINSCFFFKAGHVQELMEDKTEQTIQVEVVKILQLTGQQFQNFSANQVLKKAGVTGTGQRSPRLYDFRHTFATHRLYHWMREGKDLNAMLPYLSAYMGHAQLSDTYYYIHLVPGLLEEMSGFAFSSAEAFLPEVVSDE